MRALVIVACLVLGPTAAWATPAGEAEAWRAGLVDRIVGDLAAGKPLVVQVHVPLCDNDVIPCGNAKLGDGERPAVNLYWATTEGTAGWFGRRGGGWRQVLDADGAAVALDDVLDLRVWRREVVTPRAWRARGAPARYPLYVVAFAWRGERIHEAFTRYAEDLHGIGATAVELPDGTRLAAGGDAHVVAYVGHNHLMDLTGFDWRGLASRADATPRGALAIACHTAVYVQDVVPSSSRVPLLFTRDFLLASSAALEGAVLALAAGGDYAAIRRGGAQGYATGGKKPLARVFGAFTNPADRRWRTPGYHAAVNAHARRLVERNARGRRRPCDDRAGEARHEVPDGLRYDGRMSTWQKELGRFLERSTPLLEVGLESLKDTRALLAALRPTVDALPALVHETQGLVTDARALLREVAPLLVDAARAALADGAETRVDHFTRW